MLVSTFIQEVNDALRALDDDLPTDGTDEWNYWLRVANRIRRNLYTNTSMVWASTYQVLELGTISASATPSFELEDEFLAPANTCYVIGTDDQRTDYKIVKPQEIDTVNQEVYIAGQDPKVLYFSLEILSTQTIVDGTLYLPAYVMPDDLATAADTVVVDDPDWLVIATAAKIAANDLTYEDRAPDLNAEANALYSQMTKNNRRGTYGNARITPTSVRRITSPDRR